MTSVAMRWLTLVALAAALALSGCVEKAGQMAPAGPEARARGQVKGSRYLNPDLGIYWYNFGGYRPLAPAGGDDFVFGWQGPEGELRARLWVLPNGGEPRQGAAELAQAKGWKLKGARDISWQGRPAADAILLEGQRQGRLRVMAGPRGLVAVAVDVPAASAAEEAPDLARAMEGLRLIPPGDVLHTVKSKAETLAVVALWYTGSANRWPQIEKYNRLHSTRLTPGQELLIPAESVWRLDPMPGWMLRLAHKKATAAGRKAPAAKAAAEEGDEAPDLEMMPTGPK